VSKPELARYYSEKDGDARGYVIPTRDDLRVYGVTSVSGRYSDGENGLAQYAADVTLRWANENWNLLGSRSDEVNYRNGRFRWKDHTNHLAQVGTDAHEWIEAQLTGQPLPDLWGESLEVADQWLGLTQNHWLEPLMVERTVFHPEYGYAGTLDYGGYLDGLLTLGDVKTGRSLRENHRLQMAALAKCPIMMVKGEDGEWREEKAPEWEQFAFFHLRPAYYNPVNGASEEAYWEVDYIDPEEIDDLFSMFLGLLRMKQAEDRVKARRKA
jgi:hypothetical protein